jgi:NAD(P)-dependent dehydrogenase (short-subunit alcohol dehydrogenase family)
MRLENRTALITGASRGLGKSIALRFAAEGCDIALNYVSQDGRDNAAEAEDVAAEIKGLGRRAVCIEADVTDAAEVAAMVEEAVAALGGVDISSSITPESPATGRCASSRTRIGRRCWM